jgi:hypothetical protein
MAATMMSPLVIRNSLRLLLAMLGRTNFYFLNNSSTFAPFGFFDRDKTPRFGVSPS